MRVVFAACAGLLLASASCAEAQDKKDNIIIGVMTDTGPYADIQGPGSAEAVRMAVEDVGGKVNGRPITVVTSDPQLKADLASSIARQWFDEGVDAIVDVPGSNLSLAVQEIARERNKIVFNITSGSPSLTGKACTPTSFAWAFNTYATSKAVASGLIKAGGRTWFAIGVNSAGGKAGAEAAATVVESLGGKMLGSVFHPVDAVDFTSFVLQAQASGAKVIALASSGEHTINTIKSINEFGLKATTRVAALTFYLTDARAIGLNVGQGLQFSDTFYWNDSDETRAWSKRFFARTQKMPTSLQVAAYSAATHFLKAAAVVNPKDGVLVADQMRKTPINDVMTKDGQIRPDGFVLRDRFIYEIKAPAESTGEWDLLKRVASVDRNEAAIPLAETGCPLVKP
jgi:branched-chain amino acid transport system substrate-binding protein